MDKVIGKERLIRWLSILLLGLLLPNLSGIIDHSIGWGHLLLSYLHFILIIGAVWLTNRYWYLQFSDLRDWSRRPGRRIFLLLVVCAGTSIPIAFSGIWLWYAYPGAANVEWGKVSLVTLLVFFISLWITHIYETGALVAHFNQEEHNPNHPSSPPRLLAMEGTSLVPVPLSAISHFYTSQKVVFLKTASGKSLRTTYSLIELESKLPADSFFRANRQYLIHLKSINAFRPLADGRIGLNVTGESSDVIVSAANASLFRQWVVGQESDSGDRV